MAVPSCRHNNKFAICQCSEPGFCPLFSRTMGVDPPDWRWCQNTTADEREKYYALLAQAPPPEKKTLIDALQHYTGPNRKYFYLEYLTQHNKSHQCAIADELQEKRNQQIFAYIKTQKCTQHVTADCVEILCLGHNPQQFATIKPQPYLTHVDLNTIDAGPYSDNKWAESRVFLSNRDLFTKGTEFVGVVSASWNLKYENYARIDNFHNWDNTRILLNSTPADQIVVTADIMCVCDWTNKQHRNHNILSLFFSQAETKLGEKLLKSLGLDFTKHVKVPYGNQMILHRNLYQQYVEYLKNNEVFARVDHFLKTLPAEYFYSKTDFIKHNYHYSRIHAFLLEMVSCFWFAQQPFLYLPSTERKKNWYDPKNIGNRIVQWQK